MRIIAGEHRGRRLAAPPGQGTRPMLDRVREAMFSTLGEGIEGARALDLFAGTGSLGLEALSRGAEEVLFIERDPKVIKVLGENVRSLHLERRALIKTGDALDPRSWRALGEEPPLVVFLDPPYPFLKDERRSKVFDAIEALRNDYLAPGGRIVFHCPRRQVDAEHFAAGCVAHERVYGNSALWYIEPACDSEGADEADEQAAATTPVDRLVDDFDDEDRIIDLSSVDEDDE
jgi:16S rRNA (guanine966-N2)-methyltransferase